MTDVARRGEDTRGSPPDPGDTRYDSPPSEAIIASANESMMTLAVIAGPNGRASERLHHRPRTLTIAEARQMCRVNILASVLAAVATYGACTTSIAAPNCLEYASAVAQFEDAARAAQREFDLHRIEQKIDSGGQWAVAQTGYFEPRLALMSHKRDPSTMLRAHQRLDFAIGRFNALTRLDTEEAVFVMRNIGEVMAGFYREAYRLACEGPALEQCMTYGVAVEHLRQLAAALPEMTSDPDEIRSAQQRGFEYADLVLEDLTFPNWRHTLRNTELAFAEDQMERTLAHAAEHGDDPQAQHWVTDAVRTMHEVIYGSFCAPTITR